MGPRAGFTTIHGYAPNLPAKLLEAMQSCLSIYDNYLYPENAFNIPVVAYSGQIDKQKTSSRPYAETDSKSWHKNATFYCTLP